MQTCPYLYTYVSIAAPIRLNMYIFIRIPFISLYLPFPPPFKLSRP